jgi:hypothetical protein
MQYLKLNIEINLFTIGFEECVREETALLATLKSKSIRKVHSLPKDTAEIEIGRADKLSPGARQTAGKNLVWFG